MTLTGSSNHFHGLSNTTMLFTIGLPDRLSVRHFVDHITTAALFCPVILRSVRLTVRPLAQPSVSQPGISVHLSGRSVLSVTLSVQRLSGFPLSARPSLPLHGCPSTQPSICSSGFSPDHLMNINRLSVRLSGFTATHLPYLRYSRYLYIYITLAVRPSVLPHARLSVNRLSVRLSGFTATQLPYPFYSPICMYHSGCPSVPPTYPPKHPNVLRSGWLVSDLSSQF
ncbi:hypothetical protein BV898_19390 [Hypsibius exemplaris]|uniref:Uncharacterized protein n=1 Tax=Hypsibius exemplaris TaxID=2072580 RepID=A0A9X6NIV8_HYPEX|nr:hypothetical protein BV898_19390 [Hypsibius exemplaris]